MIDQLIINALLIIFILHPSPLMIIAVDWNCALGKRQPKVHN
jgi:hypothetical protein